MILAGRLLPVREGKDWNDPLSASKLYSGITARTGESATANWANMEGRLQ